MIALTYRAVDGFTKHRKFKTLAGAQKFAQHWAGETPDIGTSYAVTSDGVGTLYATCPLINLFPKLGPRCLDCGQVGEQTGHQECQYPQDHGEEADYFEDRDGVRYHY